MTTESIQLPLPLPEVLRPWLTLNLDYHVIVCHSSNCQQALNTNAIETHLCNKHQVNREYRLQLREYLKQWQWQYDFRDVPLPENGSLPQPVLPIIDGFQCKNCTFASINRWVIRQHCNTQHNIKRLKDKELFRTVQLQTWFREKRARYWAVNATRQSRGDASGSGSEDLYTNVRQWEEKIKKERIRLVQQTSATESNAWLAFTDWERVLAESKLDLRATYALTAMATAAEPELQRVGVAWNIILSRCCETLESINFKDILKWWQSPKPESPNPRPFQLVEKGSLKAYSNTFLRLLFYILRAIPFIKDTKVETGLVFNSQQWQCVQQIHSILQEPMAVVVEDADAPEDPRLVTAVMALVISLVTEDISQMSQYENPIMHYLAIRGIDTATATLRTPVLYTPILAQMLWMIRLIMLEIAVSDQGWPELGLLDRVTLGAVTGAVAVRIKQIRLQHLVEGSFSPASTILTQLAYGQALNRTTQAPSNIFWSDNHETIHFDGKGVAVTKIRSMCQELNQELTNQLFELGFHQSMAPLPLHKLVDSMGHSQLFRQDHYSFVDHPDNAPYIVDWTFLYQQMLRDDAQYHLAQVSSGSGSGSGNEQRQWIEQRCKAYLALEKSFLTKLSVAMHVMGGQPARGPELGSIKVRNSQILPRNIYIINGRVAVLTTYDKSQKRRNQTRYIFRCFPDILSQLIIQYLVYILPFSRIISQRTGDFLFGDDKHGPWIQDQLSMALAVATSKHLGVRLTISAWRQIAIALGNQYLQRESQVWKQDEEENEEGMAVAEDEESQRKQILTIQAAHGNRAAHNNYAIDEAFLSQLGPDLVNLYSQASRAWHQFLHLESKGMAVAVAVTGMKRSRSPSFSSEKKQNKIEISRGLQGLQKVLGPDARPRSQAQAEALELVHTAQVTQPLIIVLGTGSGKSLLFFSIAIMAIQQTVIVVVPFTALMQDLIRRARSHGLTCEEWQGQEQRQWQWKQLPQLIIVSADRAVEGSFLHFAKGLELNKQLAHVFFDECHVALTDSSYRAKLRELWQLRYLQCRFTCLTATLLVNLESKFRKNMLLEHAQLYRQSTIQPTIRYQVVDCQRDGLWQTAEPIIRRLPLPPGSRGVIYVRSYTQGESVAEELDCPFYKASATNRSELLEQWASGNGGWIVATGALGTGIDIPGIIYILHLDRPYGLTSFVQQAGRGGRTGEISDSIVILSSSQNGEHSINGGSGSRRFPPPRPELIDIYSTEAQDEAALTEYLESQICRRMILAQYLDGQTVRTDCKSTDSILCDRCQQQSDLPDASNETTESSGSGNRDIEDATIQQVLRRTAEQNEQLERFHQMLHGHCIYCQLMLPEGEDSGHSHCHRDCPHASSRQCNHDRYQQWRTQLKLAKRDQCFRCGFPQTICQAIEREESCLLPHLLLPGIWFLHQVGQLHPILEEIGFRGEEEWQWQWLNRMGESVLGQYELNWMRVWRRIGEIYLNLPNQINI